MKKNTLALVCALFLIAACSHEPAPSGSSRTSSQGFDPNQCNKDAAYEEGYNDGREGEKMNSRFADPCREDLRADARTGYKNGFTEGNKIYQEEKKAQLEAWREYHQRENTTAGAPSTIPTTTPVQTGFPNINVNIGKGNQTVGTSAGGAGNAKAYFCTVSAFMKKFDSYGPTKLEAEQGARSACAAKYHEMHCGDVQCQQNI